MGFLAWSYRQVFGSNLKAFEGIPGPTPLFPLGNSGDFLGDRPWSACEKYAKDFGGITVAWLVNAPVIVLNDPTLIAEVLEERREDFYKKNPCEALLPVTTESEIFIANDPKWASMRANHPFSAGDLPQWLAQQVAPMRRSITSAADRFMASSTATPLDLTPTLMRMTFDAFSMAVVGEEMGDQAWEEFMRVGRTGAARMSSKIPLSMRPIPASFKRAHKTLMAQFQTRIDAANKNNGADGVDLTSKVAREGTAVPADWLASTYSNIFYGGVFSATTSVITALYFLDRHPEKKAALLEALSGLDADCDLAALEGCDYLDWALKEAMRIVPAVPMYSRNVRPGKTATIGGFKIPSETTVFMSPNAIQRSAEHWPNPDSYEPERWANGVAAANPIGSDWFFPFGRGPRMCVGTDFAMAYMRTALATLLKKCSVEVLSADPFTQSYYFGVMLPEGVTGKFQAR